jgi:hypothetical protein
MLQPARFIGRFRSTQRRAQIAARRSASSAVSFWQVTRSTCAFSSENVAGDGEQYNEHVHRHDGRLAVSAVQMSPGRDHHVPPSAWLYGTSMTSSGVLPVTDIRLRFVMPPQQV